MMYSVPHEKARQKSRDGAARYEKLFYYAYQRDMCASRLPY